MSKEIEDYKKSDWLSKEEKSVIDRQFFPHGASVDDKRFCMQVAEQLNLNPLLKQIYFVPRRTNIGTPLNPNWIEKVEPIAGRDSYLTLAHRTGQLESLERYSEIRAFPTMNEQGKWVLEDDLCGVSKIYKKGHSTPFITVVRYSEYVQKTNKGEVTKFWKEKPITMIEKVAESQNLRKAFNITGLYDESELSDIDTNLNVNNINKLEKSKQKENDSLESLLKEDSTKAIETNTTIEIDIVPTEKENVSLKQKLINELMDRGATVEEAGKWCYGKNDDIFNSYLNDPASIDSILEEMRGF